MRRAALLGAVVVALGAGCVAPTEPTETGDGQGPLSFVERSDAAVVGSIDVEGMVAQFEARAVSEQVFSVVVMHDNLTLTADLDYNTNRFLFDGYVSEDGSSTVLTDEDKAVVEELGSALADEGMSQTTRDPDHRGVVIQSAGSALVRALGTWRTWSVTADLRRDVEAEAGRTINYLCGWLTGYGMKASHDCWDCWDTWDGWNYVDIGPQGSYNCYPDSCSSACGNYNVNRCGKLSCEQSGGGANGTWQYGSNSDKYAACTVWDTNAYTQDCLMHDHCVRNDHDTFSGWCSDEAADAVDDQPGARDCIMKNGCSGACGGYSSAGGCYCDSSCDTYGDCCMDKHQKCG